MERQDFIEGIRQLVDIYERNPGLEVPSYMPTWWIFTYDAPMFVQQIAAFGQGSKKYNGEDIEFTPNVLLDIKVNCKREQICARRVVGKRLVPEKIIPAMTVPEHEEEIVEWDCRPVLAAAKVKVESTEPALLVSGNSVAIADGTGGDIPF